MRIRRSGAFTLAETVGSMSLMIPIIIGCFMAFVEVSQAFSLRQDLSQAARQAAYDMAVAYEKTPFVANSRSSQDSLVYNGIRKSNVINNSQQFDNAEFDLSTTPGNVTVTVHYQSGQHGLPAFPTFDPLNIGANFPLQASATYSLNN